MQQRPHRAQGDLIRGADDAVERHAPSDQAVDRGLGRLDLEMGLDDQVGIDAQPGLPQRLEVAAVALHGLGRVEVAEEDDSLAAQPGQMAGGAPAAGEVVRPHRAVQLVGHLCAPDHEAAVGLGQPVQALVQERLTQEDHPVGTGVHRRHQVVVAGRREMAQDHVAVALARRLPDPGQQFEEEGIAEPPFPPLRPRRHQGDHPFRPDRARGHIASERIVVLARQLPDQLLGAGVDRRAVVERPRGRRDRYARQPGQVLEAGVAAAHVWFPMNGAAANFAANLACSAPLRPRLASPCPRSVPR